MDHSKKFLMNSECAAYFEWSRSKSKKSTLHTPRLRLVAAQTAPVQNLKSGGPENWQPDVCTITDAAYAAALWHSATGLPSARPAMKPPT